MNASLCAIQRSKLLDQSLLAGRKEPDTKVQARDPGVLNLKRDMNGCVRRHQLLGAHLAAQIADSRSVASSMIRIRRVTTSARCKAAHFECECGWTRIQPSETVMDMLGNRDLLEGDMKASWERKREINSNRVCV